MSTRPISSSGPETELSWNCAYRAIKETHRAQRLCTILESFINQTSDKLLFIVNI